MLILYQIVKKTIVPKGNQKQSIKLINGNQKQSSGQEKHRFYTQFLYIYDQHYPLCNAKVEF